MEKLINVMNDVLHQWKEQYDLIYNIPLQFELDANQHLSLKGKSLDLPEYAELKCVDFDIEQITFHFSDGCRIYIDIAWPENNAPYVNTVLVGYIFKE